MAPSGPAPSARAGAPPLARPRAAGRERAGKMAAAVVLLRPLCRLCRVVLFLSQFYILSGGGELRAGGPGTAGGGRVREEGAGRCGRVRHGLPPPLG